jgi:DNA-binding NarL/FixJ family response regulator
MPIRILLADDHKILREGLSAILAKKSDLDVVGHAADGQEAVQKARQLQPDAVVMDINMPTLDGIQATRQIRAQNDRIEVVILSIYATKEHVFQALHAGAKGYLLKETAGLEVVDAIRSIHAGRRYLCEKISDLMIEDYLDQRTRSPDSSPLDELSHREREILPLIVDGYSSAEIAERLHLAVSTVSTYRSRLMKKLGIKDVPELVKFAMEHHLTD